VTVPESSATDPGVLGLVHTIVDVDWSLAAKYGPRVTVVPRSPAWRSGLRNGDYIRSIDGKDFDTFHNNLPPPDTPVRIEFFRSRFGVMAVFAVMGSAPKPSTARRLALRRAPPALPGGRVIKSERPEFVQRFIARHPGLKHSDVKLLMTLLESEGSKGLVIRASVLASRMNCSLRTVRRAIASCQYFGVVRVESGKSGRHANSFEVCWPVGRERKATQNSSAVQSAASSESEHLASELLLSAGIDPASRYGCEAEPIVAGWLARGWDKRIIRKVVDARMREMKRLGLALPRTLKYFDREIANIFTADVQACS
jgi:PDZ domain